MIGDELEKNLLTSASTNGPRHYSTSLIVSLFILITFFTKILFFLKLTLVSWKTYSSMSNNKFFNIMIITLIFLYHGKVLFVTFTYLENFLLIIIEDLTVF